MTCCVTLYLRDLFAHTCEPAVKMTGAHPQVSIQVQSVMISKNDLVLHVFPATDVAILSVSTTLKRV